MFRAPNSAGWSVRVPPPVGCNSRDCTGASAGGRQQRDCHRHRAGPRCGARTRGECRMGASSGLARILLTACGVQFERLQRGVGTRTSVSANVTVVEPVGCQNSLMAADLVVLRTPRPAAEYAEEAPLDQETHGGPHQARSPRATSSLLRAGILSLHPTGDLDVLVGGVRPDAECAQDTPQDQESHSDPDQASSPHSPSSLLTATMLKLHSKAQSRREVLPTEPIGRCCLDDARARGLPGRPGLGQIALASSSNAAATRRCWSGVITPSS